ncbi:hypothetical protein DTO96_102403 [Ephemeroptericola cinctiostellae]|uniref:Major capsid protein E n=1 Tax=Ephemeroptericola cinctiostellae TaxID=2268024 RepID=A0A345DE60_9BURK|nr:major capsid protein [Ephemeroptericola cinctiostellae]AXF86648.1 hypothetical protein DTO96_102403 [Ephemeroptericola cinctiostellae]
MADLALFQDNFHLTTLTQAINNVAVPSKFLSGLGLFEESPIDTTTVAVEIQDGEIVLVANKPRGADGTAVGGSLRGAPIILTASHLPATADILADVIQNIREFGTGSALESLQTKVDEKLKYLRKSIDATLEYHRWGALNGKVLDADGTTVLRDLFNVFGLTRPSDITINFGAADVDKQFMTATDVVDEALNGAGRNGFIVLCGKNFNKEFHGSKALKDDVRLCKEGEQARNDLRESYEYKNIRFYRCVEKLAGHLMVPDNEAIMIPTGVDALLQMRFAPANYNETVNTNGLPYYVNTEPKKFNKGFDFEAQSNPLTYCSRPHVIRRLKLAGA